jgi:predicted nuclease of predicted toxin-antitoxin system
LKFLIDKVLLPKTVAFLKKKGIKTIRVDEVISGLIVEDREIFNFALKNNFIIVTADLDIGHILAITEYKKPSIIILRLDDPRVPNVEKKLICIIPKSLVN